MTKQQPFDRRHPGGIRAAVAEAFADSVQRTITEVAKQTGYAYQTVDNELSRLRRVGNPRAQLFIDGRSKAARLTDRPAFKSTADGFVDADGKPAPDPKLLEKALRSRSLLEQAWHA